MAMPPSRRTRAAVLPATLAISAGAVLVFATLSAANSGREVAYYSTAAPPTDFAGPSPVIGEEPGASPIGDKPTESAPTRVAANKRDTVAPKVSRPVEVEKARPSPEIEAISDAKSRIASCAKTFAATKDYTCRFYKRERIDGKLTAMHTMLMKSRSKPHSIYFKFVSPNAGREAIYVAGGYGGKAVVHDVGLGKLLAGTLKLDPTGSMAMEDNRHPITEAGLGHMIDTIVTAWDKELSPEESKIVFHPNARVGERACVMIESIHPRKRSDFLYHMVKVYIDKELDLPIRFEAYDWPRGNRPADLVEEYTYMDLKLNVGLGARDFDPNNKSYSFGRF